MSDELYSELQKLGVNIDEIKKQNPTRQQLQGLLDGLSRLHLTVQN